MAHDEANEPNWYGSKADGTRYDDALYNVNRYNESNWYDGNATGNTEQIKINFFLFK